MSNAPKDLKLVPLGEVPAGSLVTLVGRRDDIPLVLRLDGSETYPQIMLLGGEYSFDVTEWKVDGAFAKVVCSPDELRFKLNEPEERGNHTAAGVLTLHDGGAYLTAAPKQHAFHGVKIDLHTWRIIDTNVRHGQHETYANWEIGMDDHKGDFVSIFQRTK